MQPYVEHGRSSFSAQLQRHRCLSLKVVRNVSPPLQGIRGGNACTDLNIIDIKRSVFQEILSLDPNDSHVFQLTYGYSLNNFRKITIVFLIRLFRRMVAPFYLFPLVQNLQLHGLLFQLFKMMQCSTIVFIFIYLYLGLAGLSCPLHCGCMLARKIFRVKSYNKTHNQQVCTS